MLALCSILVSDQHFVRGEAAIFEAVNGGPRWIGAPLEVVMQLGTLPAAVVVTALVAGAILPGRPLLVVSMAIGVFAAWRLDDVAKLTTKKGVVDDSGVPAHTEKADDAIVGATDGLSHRPSGERLGQVEMQSHIDAAATSHLGGPLGVLHEHHRRGGRDSTGVVARNDGIGLGGRAPEVVGIDNDHGAPAVEPAASRSGTWSPDRNSTTTSPCVPACFAACG